MYLLDTNALSEVINHPYGHVASKVIALEPQSLLTSVIVACELRYGVEQRGSKALRAQVDGALERFTILPLGGEVIWHYARLRTDLERRGLPIGANDMLIAAHALSVGATLVTDNTREFERVGGLAIENWLRPA